MSADLERALGAMARYIATLEAENLRLAQQNESMVAAMRARAEAGIAGVRTATVDPGAVQPPRPVQNPWPDDPPTNGSEPAHAGMKEEG